MIPSVKLAIYAFLSLRVLLSKYSIFHFDLSHARYKSPLHFFLGSPPPPLTLDSGRHFARPLLLDGPMKYIVVENEQRIRLARNASAVSQDLVPYNESKAGERNYFIDSFTEYSVFLLCMLAGFLYTGNLDVRPRGGIRQVQPDTINGGSGLHDTCGSPQLDRDTGTIEPSDMSIHLNIPGTLARSKGSPDLTSWSHVRVTDSMVPPGVDPSLNTSDADADPGMLDARPPSKPQVREASDDNICGSAQLDQDARTLGTPDISTHLDIPGALIQSEDLSHGADPSVDAVPDDANLPELSPAMVHSFINSCDSDVFLASKTFVGYENKSFFSKDGSLEKCTIAPEPTPFEICIDPNDSGVLTSRGQGPTRLIDVSCPFALPPDGLQADASFEYSDGSPLLPNHIDVSSRLLSSSMHTIKDILNPESIPWGDSILFGSQLELDFFLSAIQGTQAGPPTRPKNATRDSIIPASSTFTEDNMRKAQDFWDDPIDSVYAYTPRQSPTFRSITAVPSFVSLFEYSVPPPAATSADASEAPAIEGGERYSSSAVPFNSTSVAKRRRTVTTQTEMEAEGAGCRYPSGTERYLDPLLGKRTRLADEQKDWRQRPSGLGLSKFRYSRCPWASGKVKQD